MPDSTQYDKDLRAAITLIRNGQSERAIPLLDHLVDINPTCMIALRERGFAKSFRGYHDSAIADFTTLISRRPDDPDGYIRRAAARERAGDRTGAIDDYSTAIVLNPQHSYAYIQRGRQRAMAGDLVGAEADFTASILHNNTGPLSGLLNRGPVRHRLGNVQGAIDDLTEAMRFELPPPVYAPLFRGRVRLAIEDYTGAIEDFSVAVESFPQLNNAYRLRAEARARAGDPAGAEEDYRRYEELGGYDLPAYE